jgi:hypothetical protein
MLGAQEERAHPLLVVTLAPWCIALARLLGALLRQALDSSPALRRSLSGHGLASSVWRARTTGP